MTSRLVFRVNGVSHHVSSGRHVTHRTQAQAPELAGVLCEGVVCGAAEVPMSVPV